MSFKKSDYYTLVKQAGDVVPGFRQVYNKFVEHAVINQKSKSLVTNYSRNVVLGGKTSEFSPYLTTLLIF